MRRRDFIAGIAGSAAAWPFAAHAQPAGRPPTVGFLGQSTPAVESQRISAFVERLRELGWTEGRTIAIEVRWADGRTKHYAEIATEFARLKVDIIVTAGTPSVIAARQAAAGIPIVFATATDPIGNALVASLARPGGNITGLSILGTDLAGKRLELLRDLVPALHTLATMANVDNPAVRLEMMEVQAAARTLGLEFVIAEVRRAEDIAPAISALKNRAEALYVVGDALVIAQRIRLVTLPLSAKLPTIYNSREYVDAGGLMSYGPNFPDLFRRAADYVDKILRGAKAADLPIEQPTKFDLIINLTTAKALGITVPPTLLARADEVIE
jgi:putative ABC transport system substrate-binding protein